MNRRSLMILFSLALAAPAFAANKKAAPAPSPAAGMPTPDQMQKAMALGQPSANHKLLAPMEGTFDYTATMWMTPGAEPMVSTGTSTQTLIFGGRFLRQNVAGNMGPMPFEGVGYTGYDNIRGEYQSVWMDNMMTGMMLSSGKPDPAAGTLSQSGTFSCPMTGEKNHAFRTETHVVNADKMTYSSFDKDSAGKEFKGMEIVYTRAK